MNFFSKIIGKRSLYCVPIVLIGGALVYPQWNSRIELSYQDTKFHRYTKEKHKEISKEHFFPTLYLGYGFLQALYGSMSQLRHENIIHNKQYLDLGDYGEISYDTANLVDETLIPELKRIKNQNNLIIILLGITAASNEPYIENMAAEALKEGYKVILFNERLYNNYESKGRIYPRSGYYDIVKDFEHFIEHLKTTHSNYDFYAIGHSFGANTLVKYLGTHVTSNPFKGAVSVGNPFDLDMASRLISPTINRYHTTNRIKILQMRETLFQNPPSHMTIDLEKVYLTQTTQEYDDLFSRIIHGYSSIAEYYQSISCINQLKNVNIPLLCINSKDDPCIPQLTIPLDIPSFNKNIMLLVTQCGGHVGWFQGIFSPRRWYMKPALEFLSAIPDFAKTQ